ncbi:ATP-binding cassette domain-containing protein [Paenibacillus dakarensis]|uniref:ATP-binding cassette domain-containing protein n=1 Tax=Paenibacillus dakarensis TaxID=1527293 RepID=UPI0006D590F0|nr:ATP-binding cassette domain-containing protein [Paenibacillus dakarensis]
MKTEILRMERVTIKKEDSTPLDNFNLNIFQAEIMGLVCLNLTGKELLIDLIRQNTPIHYGRVYFDEVLVNNYQHSPLTMNKVFVIEQKSSLIEDLSVADNIFIPGRGLKHFFIRPHALNKQLQRFTEELGIHIDGRELVANLSAYEKCVVKLLRAVFTGARLIVVRDISSSISAAELSNFHALLRYYCQKGFSFLYICNHPEEAFQICDRLRLMRDGKILKLLGQSEFNIENVTPYYLADYANRIEFEADSGSEEEILRFQNVCTDQLNDLSFSIVQGECTLLLDMDNVALSDIWRLMNGEMKPDRGLIMLEDAPYTDKQARHAVSHGLAFIQENPVETMLFKEMSYLENLYFMVDKKQNPIPIKKSVINSIIHEYEPFVGEEIYETHITNLKLHSLYNLVYYRIHLCNPKIVFCVQPFAGADMYLRMHLIHLMNQLRKKGITVVILDVNFGDTLAIADKLIVLEQGRFGAEYARSEFHHFRPEGMTR